MVDITIRGAGIFGLSIAWACVQRGASVQVIDPHGVAAGSSGGIVGALAPHVPENWNPKRKFQFDSLLMAEGFWEDIAAVSGQETGYLRAGRLQSIPDKNYLNLARQRAETAQALWQGHATWELVRATGAPWEPHSPTGMLIFDTLSAHLHPRKACHALAAALAVRGVPILPEGKDRGCVLWATGVAGLQKLNEGHHRLVGGGTKGQAALLRYEAPNVPQIYASNVHIIPHTDGTVAIGSTSESEYEDGTSTDAQLDAVIEAARTAVPALRDAPVIDRWAGVRPRTRSRAPMLGHWPGRTGHYIANGGFKIGFGMAPKIAEVMADLMLDNRDTIPPRFRVEDSL